MEQVSRVEPTSVLSWCNVVPHGKCNLGKWSICLSYCSTLHSTAYCSLALGMSWGLQEIWKVWAQASKVCPWPTWGVFFCWSQCRKLGVRPLAKALWCAVGMLAVTAARCSVKHLRSCLPKDLLSSPLLWAALTSVVSQPYSSLSPHTVVGEVVPQHRQSIFLLPWKPYGFCCLHSGCWNRERIAGKCILDLWISERKQPALLWFCFSKSTSHTNFWNLHVAQRGISSSW